MATRLAARYVSRRFSSGGNILGQQEKAHAQNVLSNGAQNTEATSASSGRGYAKTRGSTTEAPTKKKKIDYAFVADVVAFLGGIGCYLSSQRT